MKLLPHLVILTIISWLSTVGGWHHIEPVFLIPVLATILMLVGAIVTLVENKD